MSIPKLLGDSAVASAAASPAAASTDDAEARSAVTSEAGASHAGGMRASVMLSNHLDVVVGPAAVGILIFNAKVREVHLTVEIRQVVLEGPGPNLLLGAIGMAVVACTVAIPLVQPALVVALELVVEQDPFDPGIALGQAVGCAFVGAIDLKVVLALALAFEAMPERLTAVLAVVTMALEQASSFPRECYAVLAGAGHSSGLDQALLAEVAEVAFARVVLPVAAIAEITTGDHSEGPDGSQGTRLGAPQGVFAITTVHDFALESTRQPQLPREGVSWVDCAGSNLAVPVGPPRVAGRTMGVVAAR